MTTAKSKSIMQASGKLQDGVGVSGATAGSPRTSRKAAQKASQAESNSDSETGRPVETFLEFLARVAKGACTVEEASWVRQWEEDQALPAEYQEDVLPKKPRSSSPRDRMREGISAAQKKATVLVSLQEKRRNEADTWRDLIFISRFLVAMSLPYEPVKERQIVKSARLGDGRRVHLQLNAAIPGIDLPYGSDRTLLHWLLDQIARQIQQEQAKGGETSDPDILERARFVRWAKASDYLRDMGLAVNSGKNYTDLRARYRRLSGLSIGLRIEGPEHETLANIPLIESATLPTAVDIRAEFQGQQRLEMEGDELTFGVLFSKKLVATLMDSAVPFPKEILRQTRKQSQMQDYFVFLAWRSFGARNPTTIPWDEVREQLWQQDQTARRIKTRFRDAIKALRVIWPELQAESREKGLWIAQPKHGVQLIEQGGNLKRLAIKD